MTARTRWLRPKSTVGGPAGVCAQLMILARHHDASRRMSIITTLIESSDNGEQQTDDAERTDDAITLPTAVNKVVVEARVAHDLGPPSIEIVRTNSVQLVGELDTAGELSAHAHHVFLLSDAGKPIYSRHGDCDAHANLFAVIQTLCANRAEQGDDTLHSFKYRNWRCVFVRPVYKYPVTTNGECSSSTRAPLIYLCARRVGRNERAPVAQQLRDEVRALDTCIASILTRSQVASIFDARHNYDLRRLLTGTTNTMDSCVRQAHDTAEALVDGVRSLPMADNVRDALTQAIVYARNSLKLKNLVFAVCVARGQLVTCVRLKQYTLAPIDVRMLINLVACNPAFRNVQTWSPVCLPAFDDSGFLHTYITYLDETDVPTSDLCMLLLTVDRDSFTQLADMHQRVIARLRKVQMLQAVIDACSTSDGAATSSAVQLSIAGNTNAYIVNNMWHFVYKNVSTSYTCVCALQMPYVTQAERAHMMRVYRNMIGITHAFNDDHTADAERQPLKILWTPARRYSSLAWVAVGFELYAIFSPLASKATAVASVDKLIKFLQKDEQRLFIKTTSTF